MKVPLTITRKTWERIFIIQALASRGCISPGSRGLGFGVGADPMIPVMVKHGCELVATDYGNSEFEGWGAGLDLDPRNVAGAELMSEKVTQRNVDMNAIPDDLRDFDFTYSCGSLEHIGSLEKGFQFVENAMDCLRPGGYAVHTTELNISGGSDTLDKDGIGFYLPDQVDRLFSRLRDAGHEVAPMSASGGSLSEDLHVARRPYAAPCLKVWHSGYKVTSMGFVIRAKGGHRFVPPSGRGVLRSASDVAADATRGIGRRLAAVGD